MKLPRCRTILGVVLAGLLPPLAQAADLAPEPVDFLRMCNSEGEGFFVIPGTDTCLRISGRARTDYNVFYNSDRDFNFEPAQGRGITSDRYRLRARGWFNWDTRTQTEFGRLRTYGEFRLTYDYDGPTDAGLHKGFVELGGLRLGRSTSYYDFLGVRFTQTEFFDPQFSRDNPQLLAAYEGKLGDRGRLALSIEDNTGRQDGITSETLTTNYGGAQLPDVIVRYQLGDNSDPAYVQLMGATHYVNTVTDTIGGTGEQLGFAVGAGVATNLPFGRNSRIGLTTSFARGALNFATTNASAPHGLATDGVFDPATNTVKLSNYVTVAAGGRTDIAPRWEVAFQAGFLYGDPGGADTDFDNDGAVDDLDFINVDLQSWVGFSPVSGFLMGVGSEFRFVEAADFGQAGFLTVYFRAQRSF